MPAGKQSCLLLSLLLAAKLTLAWETLTPELDLNCSQNQEFRLDCSYRPLIPEPPLSIAARHDEETLSIENRQGYPRQDSITAAVLLVDTSDPARQPVIERNKRQIERILEQTKPHHWIGLASFDNTLRLQAPIGSSRDDIIAAADTLEATGMTTELYRSTLEAIKLLAGVDDAHRKAIFLFSDGQAEDKAYFHQDVTRAARKHNVVINSLGFQRSVTQSVALQTLRRLSEETGGVYIESNKNHALPASFLEGPFDNIDRGGRFSVDFRALASLGTDRADIRIDFATDPGNIGVDVPVSLPVKSLPEATDKAAAPDPQVTPPVQIVTRPSGEEPNNLDKWLWYGAPFILLMLILVTMITLILLLSKSRPKRPSHQPAMPEFKPYAYLISQDEEQTRYPITRTTWRIGRSRDNEISLDDNSVSRRHAELQRLTNGSFVIYDHSSLNGVFVNNEKIYRQKLEEGDIIEIGDHYLRFTQYPSDYKMDENTVMQKTRAPSLLEEYES